jgi:hypothetical protein
MRGDARIRANQPLAAVTRADAATIAVHATSRMAGVAAAGRLTEPHLRGMVGRTAAPTVVMAPMVAVGMEITGAGQAAVCIPGPAVAMPLRAASANGR